MKKLFTFLFVALCASCTKEVIVEVPNPINQNNIDKINDLNQTINELNSNIYDLNNEIQSLDQSNDDLNELLDDANNTIAYLDAHASDLEDQIDIMYTYEEVQDVIDQIGHQYEVAYGYELGNLQSQISHLENEIISLENDIENLTSSYNYVYNELLLKVRSEQVAGIYGDDSVFYVRLWDNNPLFSNGPNNCTYFLSKTSTETEQETGYRIVTYGKVSGCNPANPLRVKVAYSHGTAVAYVYIYNESSSITLWRSSFSSDAEMAVSVYNVFKNYYSN